MLPYRKFKSPFCFLLSAFRFLLFSLSPFLLFAQQIDIDENAQNRIMATPPQNCDYYAGFFSQQTTLIENNKQIPAFGLYQNRWDTLFIRGEKIEIPFFDDQLKIILMQEGNTPFAFPVSGIVSTRYIKIKGKQHSGIDFTVSKNEPVVACFDGVVRISNKFAEYGNTLIIRHYNGLETLYALLDNVCVVSGQIVKAGEVIGHISNANPEKKDALHFEIRFLNEFFNPEKVINLSDRKLQSNLLTLSPNDFIFVPVLNPNPDIISEETDSDNDSSLQQLLETPTALPLFHTVKQGDTIFKICTKYNITEQQLRSLNPIKGNNIYVGQKLRIQ